MKEINAVDLAFVVDTTGSMGNLIGAAQQQMIKLIAELTGAADIDLRLGVVEYRDHPPQDQLVARAYPFTADLKQAQATINSLRANGGGDGPESVLDGVAAAARELEWRPHARRLAVLVGDWPPHGVGAPGDAFPKGCPCGETIDTVTATAEEARVTLYALGLTDMVADSFGRLARATGGEYFPAHQGDAAMQRLKDILAVEFRDLEFDRRVLAERQARPGLPLAELAARLESSRPAVSRAVSRLGARGLLA
ncbi:MAG: VWA domain-containing protein [Gemmataceae bacterium]|nr:VWA domain-containing protein [Gemmataceae bacterium]